MKEALGLWEERERPQAKFRETLDEAKTSLARGKGTEITRVSMRQLTEDILQRTGARLAAEHKEGGWHAASLNAPRRTGRYRRLHRQGKRQPGNR